MTWSNVYSGVSTDRGVKSFALWPPEGGGYYTRSSSTSTSVAYVMPKSLWTCSGMLISVRHSAFSSNSVTHSVLSFTFLREESHRAQKKRIQFKNLCLGPQLLHLCLSICHSIFSRTRKFLTFTWALSYKMNNAFATLKINFYNYSLCLWLQLSSIWIIKAVISGL